MAYFSLLATFLLLSGHLLACTSAKAVFERNSPLDYIKQLENRALDEYLKQAGLRSLDDDPNRIVGGEDAAEGDAPFQAQLFFNRWWPLPVAPSFTCGGSLISPTTVLSAGHCVISTNGNRYRIRYGSNSRLSSKYPDAEVKQIKLHPKFDLDTVQNDLALFILKKPIQPGNNVRAIELQPKAVPDKTETTLFGFGLTSGTGSSTSKTLQKTKLQTISEEECTKYIAGFGMTKHPGMLCTKAEGKSACNGDSGGPLVVTESGLQTGIVSFGTARCPAGSTNVFTYVPEYLEWINENMEK